MLQTKMHYCLLNVKMFLENVHFAKYYICIFVKRLRFVLFCDCNCQGCNGYPKDPKTPDLTWDLRFRIHLFKFSDLYIIVYLSVITTSFLHVKMYVQMELFVKISTIEPFLFVKFIQYYASMVKFIQYYAWFMLPNSQAFK